jgi:formylglycine-generating enzyme required for sulfatase activity
MRSLFSRFAKPAHRRGVRRREVFFAQFDGGQSAATYGTSIHLGCDVLERRIVLTASESDFVFSQGTITGYTGGGGVVDIPSTIGGLPVTAIGQSAFDGNSALTSVSIPNSVKTIGDYAFRANTSLASLKIGNNVTSIGVYAFQASALTGVSIPNSMVAISRGAFEAIVTLKSVTIPNSVRTIGDYAFNGDISLSTVRIGNKVTSIGISAFDGNSALTSVSIPNSVKTIGDYAFRANTAMKSLTIGNHVTSIGVYAFQASALTSVSIPNSVVDIGRGAFEAVVTLKSVTIPDSVRTIGDYAFNGDISLSTVRIGKQVTSIGVSAFEANTALKSVTFTANAPAVGANAFARIPFGAKAIRATGLTGYGSNGTIWNNLLVCPPGRVAAPTVTVSTATLPQDAPQITIKGTGFVPGVPAANTVTFDNGAVGTVTAATATRLTVTFSNPPISTGPLKAIVTTNIGGTSGVAKQVATVKITYLEVTVGNPNNANDTGGSKIGSVSYFYEIGKYDVTLGQYAAFLNSVAKTDTYSLYNSNMATYGNVAGIQQNGSSGSFTYSVFGSPYRPITYVSWFDAARYSNWMTNGQGSGSTETGAYTLNGKTSGDAVAANPSAKFRLPTENEWYKAAFYSPTLNGGTGGYYKYATQSDTAPGNVVGNTPNQANYYNGSVYSVTQSSSYYSSQNYLTDVGAFSMSGSFYGTFDQSGNVFQWNDLDGTAGSSRGVWGGHWHGDDGSSELSSSGRYTAGPSGENRGFGFRLASPVDA